jgi:hypothetical protein
MQNNILQPTLVLRNIKHINQVLGFLDQFDLENLISKYHVDDYVKTFHTIDLVKIVILHLYSKERHFKNFLEALMTNAYCCKLFGVQKVSVQQVYKALDSRCWMFFYEAFHQISSRLNIGSPEHKLFKGREIKILDSTFLTYALSRIFFAKLGYCSSEQKYAPGIKLHTLFNYSTDSVEDFIETSGNVHDSRVADTLLKTFKNCVILFDKGYQNLNRFQNLTDKEVLFVIPLRQKLKFKVLDEKILYYETGNVITNIVELTNGLRVRYVNIDGFELICNDCSLQWYEITTLYSFRWEIEELFKKLKQTWTINKPLFRNQNSIMAFICITLMAITVLTKICQKFEYESHSYHHILGREIEAYLIIQE